MLLHFLFLPLKTKKMKKKIVTLMMLGGIITSQAQTKDNQWSIGLQGGTTHYKGELSNEFYKFDDIHPMVGFQVSKYMTSLVDFQIGLKHGQIDESIFLTNLFDLNAVVKLKLNNGKILKEDAKIAPYVFLGFGDAISETKDYATGRYSAPVENFNFPLGFGIDFKLTERIALTLESQFNYTVTDFYDLTIKDDGDWFQFNSIGLSYNFKGKQDADKDGIVDSEDKCPDVPGTVATGGCPDSDGDGFADNMDQCPDLAGTDNGCPEIDKDVKDIMSTAMKGLLFNTGSAEIKTESYPVLDAVYTILKENPTYMLTVEGHTDNTGNEAKNLALSKSRAASAKKYLVDKGIDEKRIRSNGFGITKPIADNSTPEGRLKNRRVEFNIVFF